MNKNKMKFKRFRINVDNVTKIINGKKYKSNGVVPKEMADDLSRMFRKHGLVLEVEPDEFDKNKIKLWSRRGKRF